MTDLESAFYWTGLRDKRILLQQCGSCGQTRFPPMPACPWCGATESELREASGRGTVYSWVRVHRAFAPQFAGDVPYTVAVVELDEGPRVLARLDQPAPIGAAVVATFLQHDEQVELRFGAAS